MPSGPWKPGAQATEAIPAEAKDRRRVAGTPRLGSNVDFHGARAIKKLALEFRWNLARVALDGPDGVDKELKNMPIREQEVQCFPDTLLSRDWEPQADHRWWVVHTKARQEKSIARDLLAQEIPYFLPQIAKTSIIGGRKRTSHIPLFTSYVFLYGTEEQRYRSFKTNRVAQILAVEQQDQLCDDLRQVWRLLEEGTPLTPESRLQPGDRVRVCGGSLDGIEGTVIARRKKCRLLVAVRLLQQGVSVEVDDFMLEPIG